jgi:hypothetical protein
MTQDVPPEAEDRVRSLLGDLIEGRWEQARGEFDEGLRGRADADLIARAWTDNTPPDGGFKGMGVPSARQSGGYSVVSVPLAFRVGDVTVRVVLDPDGKASGLGMEYPRREWLGLRRSVRFFAIGNGDPEVARTLRASGPPGLGRGPGPGLRPDPL